MTEVDTLAEWLLSRPPAVQKLAAEFPLESIVMMRGKRLMISGYTEDDRLILSDPRLSYEEGHRRRVYLCADHLRQPNPDIKVIG